MSAVELAVACFREGFSCAQAVFSTYATEFGLDREKALAIAGAFGGGMGRLGEVCGAVTGAFMLIGLKHGKIRAEDDQARDTTYALVREFADKFKSRNGSIRCKELLGYDISTPEGLALAEERELFSTVCPKLVRDAAEIIEQMLATADAEGG